MLVSIQSNELLNIGQATNDQLAAFIRAKIEIAGRLLPSRMENGFLFIHYRTRGGYYVRAIHNQYGQTVNKQYFLNWNDEDGQPFNGCFPKDQIENE